MGKIYEKLMGPEDPVNGVREAHRASAGQVMALCLKQFDATERAVLVYCEPHKRLLFVAASNRTGPGSRGVVMRSLGDEVVVHWKHGVTGEETSWCIRLIKRALGMGTAFAIREERPTYGLFPEGQEAGKSA